MTQRQFYDWQTAGGGGDVAVLVEALERRKNLMRLVESHPELVRLLPAEVQAKMAD